MDTALMLRRPLPRVKWVPANKVEVAVATVEDSAEAVRILHRGTKALGVGDTVEATTMAGAAEEIVVAVEAMETTEEMITAIRIHGEVRAAATPGATKATAAGAAALAGVVTPGGKAARAAGVTMAAMAETGVETLAGTEATWVAAELVAPCANKWVEVAVEAVQLLTR